MNEQSLIRLREFLFKEFSEDELATVCQELGLNYAQLPGEGAFGKTRGMVEVAQNRDLIPALISRVRDLRPEAYRIAAIRTHTQHVAPPVDAKPAPPVRTKPHPALVIVLLVFLCALAAGGATLLNQWMLSRQAAGNTTDVSAVGTGIGSQTSSVSQTAVDPIVTPTFVTATTPTTTAMPPTTLPTPQASPTSQASPTLPPISSPTATSKPLPTATAEVPTATNTPAPSSTPPVTSTGAAIQAVLDANTQLAAYYSGQTSGDALRLIWGGDTYAFVIAYPTKTLKRTLGVDVKPGDGMTATLNYLQQPAVVGDNGTRWQLTSREYWRYAVGNQVACETIDYSYTLAKAADRYQIVAYKGDIVSTATAGACE